MTPNDPEKVDLVKNRRTEGTIDRHGTMLADDGIASGIVVDETEMVADDGTMVADGVEIVIVPEVETVIDDEIQEETDDGTTEVVAQVGDEVMVEIKNKNGGNQIVVLVREARVRNRWVIQHLVAQLPVEIFKQVYLH